MKNKPYPLYSLPIITDLKDMVRSRAKNTPNDVAFSYSAGKNRIVNKTCLEFLRMAGIVLSDRQRWKCGCSY